MKSKFLDVSIAKSISNNLVSSTIRDYFNPERVSKEYEVFDYSPV